MKTLQKVVTAIDKLDMADRDTQGDVYEYLLSKLSTSGTNGQFRTPRHIIKMIVELMKPSKPLATIEFNKKGLFTKSKNIKDFLYMQNKLNDYGYSTFDLS